MKNCELSDEQIDKMMDEIIPVTERHGSSSPEVRAIVRFYLEKPERQWTCHPDNLAHCDICGMCDFDCPLGGGLRRTPEGLKAHAADCAGIWPKSQPEKPELSERVKLLTIVAATIASNSTTSSYDPKIIITRSCDWAEKILAEAQRRQK